MIARRFPALVALVLLGACTSVPSTKTVAEEIVESLEGVPQAVKDCMTERLADYSDEDLEAIGDANPNFSSARADVPTTPELDDFIADLGECTDDTVTDDTDGGEPSGESTATTDA